MNNESTLALKIAAAYIRVSDARQEEFSPTSQLLKVREYAAKEGYIIPDELVFYDDGISGRSTKRRNDFNRMIAMAKEKDHPFDKIYVWKFSRFARCQEDAIFFKSVLAKHGVSVVSVSEPIPDGQFGSLIERIIEWMDAFYSENLSVEVMRGMLEKLRRGEPICAPAYGYDIIDKKYVPNPTEAPVVRDIFERFVDGQGMRSIAKTLNDMGVQTKYKNAFESRSIEFILQNPVYIGKLRYSQNGAYAVKNRKFKDEDLVIYDGKHEPIITNELWEKAQKRLEEIKRLYQRNQRREQPVPYMLKGLVRCSNCGGTLAMGAKYSPNVRSLQCCKYQKALCTVSHSVALPTITNTVIEGIEEAVHTLKFNIEPRIEAKKSHDTPDFAKLISYEEKKLERAKQAYLTEIETLEWYAGIKKEVEKRISDLKELEEKNKPKADLSPKDFSKKVVDVLKVLKNPEVSEEAKNQALRTVIDRIVFFKATQTVQIFFYD